MSNNNGTQLSVGNDLRKLSKRIQNCEDLYRKYTDSLYLFESMYSTKLPNNSPHNIMIRNIKNRLRELNIRLCAAQPYQLEEAFSGR